MSKLKQLKEKLITLQDRLGKISEDDYHTSMDSPLPGEWLPTAIRILELKKEIEELESK